MTDKLIKISRTVAAIVLLLSAKTTFAQSPIYFDVKKIVPTSPEAAMIGRFGEVPVGLYNGTADISIPLYTIKEAGLEIPIVLKYHSSGVKVADEATWVGLGWSLEPEGAVIKTVVGGMDENFSYLRNDDSAGFDYLMGRGTTGVFSQGATVGNALWDCFPDEYGTFHPNKPGDTQPILNKLLLGDWQPDIYLYSIPGGVSGKFYIDPSTQKAVMIDKQEDLDIKKLAGGIEITTLDGNKFIFTTQEIAGANIADYSSTTWKLSQIKFNNGKVISFTYKDGHTAGDSYSETYHDSYPFQSAYQFDKQDVSTDNTVKYLSQITADDVIVKFNHEDREDLWSVNDNDGDNSNGTLSVKRLKSIDIINPESNNKVKSFEFYYSYFGNSIIGGNYHVNSSQQDLNRLGKRLRLDSLKEVGYDNNQQPLYQPAYKFEYNTTIQLPLKSSYAKDFWGYYNSKNNTKLLPDMYYFYYSDFIEYEKIPASTMNAYAGADRSTDTASLKAGMLTKITYPTKGYTTFDYEANQFANYSYPDLAQLQNLKQNVYIRDQNKTSDTKSYTFTLSADRLVQFTNSITSGPLTPTQSLTFSDLQPSTVTLSKTVNGTTTVMKQWFMNSLNEPDFNANGGTFTWTADTVSLKANTSYTIAVELPDAVGTQDQALKQAAVSSSFIIWQQPTGNYKLSHGGGVRIKGVTNRDASGKFINRNVYNYTTENGTSSGKLMSPLRFLYKRTMVGTQVTPPGYYIGAVQEVWFISSESAIPYSTSAGGNLIGYSRVEELKVNESGNPLGKSVFYYNNQESNTKINNPDDPNLLNGKLSTEMVLTTNGDTLSRSDYSYHDLNPSLISFKAVKLFSNFVGHDPCDVGDILGGGAPFKWEIHYYPINSKWYKLDRKTTKSYNNNQIVKTDDFSFYNSKGQLVKDSTANSAQQPLVNLYKYPVDINPSSRTSVENALIDSSFYNNILEYKLIKSNVEVSKAKLSYAIKNSQLVKDKIERSNNGAALYTDVVFASYGPNKTLRQAKIGDLMATSWQWDKKQNQIIAECKNATETEFYYEGFEESIAAGVNTGTGHTGKKYTTNTSISWTKPNSREYVITYWYRSGGVWLLKQEQAYTGSSFTLTGGDAYDDVRIYPKDAQMTTYTYEPLVGMTSATDAKGQTTYYEYDAFQRLVNIKDQNGNIVKHTDYHYQNQ